MSYHVIGVGKEEEAALAAFHVLSTEPLIINLALSTALDERTLTDPIAKDNALALCSGADRVIHQVSGIAVILGALHRFHWYAVVLGSVGLRVILSRSGPLARAWQRWKPL